VLRKNGTYIIIFCYRSFCAKWVNMEDKIQKYEGGFAKVENLRLNRKCT
jgi:hypothetical protein